jgi:hypothetical protein
MMRGMADGHPFADLDANDDGAVELTRSGRTAASLSTCPVRPPSSVKRCYGTPNCIGGGIPGVGVELAENGKGAPEGPVLNWGVPVLGTLFGAFLGHYWRRPER